MRAGLISCQRHVNEIPEQELAFILSHCHVQEGIADGRQTFDILKSTRQKPTLFSTTFSKSTRKQINANIIQVKVLFQRSCFVTTLFSDGHSLGNFCAKLFWVSSDMLLAEWCVLCAWKINVKNDLLLPSESSPVSEF